MDTNYSTDVCVLDDTMCTNFYGLPLEVIIVEDENGKNQLLTFALMEGKCKPSFIQYFKNLRSLIGPIRVFVTDRNQTQISALEEVFPESIIIYCIEHIKRNLEIVPEIHERLVMMLKHEITEDELLNDFREYIKLHPKTKSSNLLQNLLDCLPRWLPSITKQYLHRSNDTTNRVEGFFGSFKNLNGHRLLPLAELVESIFVMSDRQFINSRNTQNDPVPHHIISEKDSKKLGSVALTKIREEYKTLKSHVLTNRYSQDYCSTNMIYGIPCRHLMLERIEEYDEIDETTPLLTLADFDPRWMHNYDENVIGKVQSQVSIKKAKKIEDDDWTYTACINRFEKYFTVAKKSHSIQDILKETIKRLESEEHSADIDQEIRPPNCLLLSGAPDAS